VLSDGTAHATPERQRLRCTPADRLPSLDGVPCEGGGEVAELRVTLGEILPVKEAARTLPRAIDQLEREEAAHFLITRRSRPSAVLVAVERYEALLRAEAQLAI
jgi:hypothetical protein